MPGVTSPQNYPYPNYGEAVNVPSSLQALATAVDTSLAAVQANILAALSRKAVRVTSFSAQSIPNLTLTVVTYTLEDYDTDNMFTIGTSNSNINVNTGGTYRAVGTVRFSTNATGDRQVTISKNGVPVSNGNNVTAVSGAQTQVTAHEIVQCVPGDVLTLRVSQASGGALNTESAKFALYRAAS